MRPVPLKELDVAAHLRFASVYRAFESLSDFEAEITAHHPGRNLAMLLIHRVLAATRTF